MPYASLSFDHTHSPHTMSGDCVKRDIFGGFVEFTHSRNLCLSEQVADSTLFNNRAQSILKVKEHFTRTIYSAANARRRSPGWVYLGNNDLGHVCSLCPQHPHYRSRESLVSSSEIDILRYIINTYCFPLNPYGFPSTRKLAEPHVSDRSLTTLNPAASGVVSRCRRRSTTAGVEMLPLWMWWMACGMKGRGRNYTTNLWLFPLATSPHTEITAIIAAFSASRSGFGLVCFIISRSRVMFKCRVWQSSAG